MARLSEFAAQAAKEPWTLDDDTGEALVTVRQPTAGTLRKMAKEYEALDSAEERGIVFLRAVCGPAYDDLMAITEDMPAGADEAVFDDLMKHFGLGNS